MNYFNSRQAQTAFPIRLPTLGQKVKLGYVYNYNEDTIAVLNGRLYLFLHTILTNI